MGLSVQHVKLLLCDFENVFVVCALTVVSIAWRPGRHIARRWPWHCRLRCATRPILSSIVEHEIDARQHQTASHDDSGVNQKQRTIADPTSPLLVGFLQDLSCTVKVIYSGMIFAYKSVQGLCLLGVGGNESVRIASAYT